MERILILDEKNYPPELDEIRRVAVRGIILMEGRLLLLEDSFGNVKLPGGGMEPGEDDRATLLREVREETGYEVLPESIRPFGEIEEKRLSAWEPKIFHQFSRLYCCDVARDRGTCSYTETERRLGFHLVRWTPDEAIERSRLLLQREGEQPWNRREYHTLLLIRQRLGGGDV